MQIRFTLLVLGFEHFWSIHKMLYFSVVSQRKQPIFTRRLSNQLLALSIRITEFQAKVILLLILSRKILLRHQYIIVPVFFCVSTETPLKQSGRGLSLVIIWSRPRRRQYITYLKQIVSWQHPRNVFRLCPESDVSLWSTVNLKQTLVKVLVMNHRNKITFQLDNCAFIKRTRWNYRGRS